MQTTYSPIPYKAKNEKYISLINQIKFPEKMLYFLLVAISLLSLIAIWSRTSINNVDIDTDLGRDLTELSNIWQGKVVWLGPRLSPGLHASSSYYYFLYPFLVLGGGNVRALFVATLVLSASALAWFGYKATNKYGLKAILGVLVIGISYWWDRISFHPGNGFTFATFAFAGLISMYFHYPLFLSAFLLGVGLAFHPTTIFVIPLLMHEWWSRKHSLKQLVLIIIGLILPSAPLIAFEIITKGYVIRNFLAHPNSVVQQMMHMGNIYTLASFVNLSLIVFLVAWIALGFRVRERLRIWYWLMTIQFPFFVSLFGFSGIYMFAVAAACQFILVIQLLKEKKVGVLLLVAWIFIGMTKVGSFVGTSSQPRLLYTIETATKTAIDSQVFQKNEPTAVLAVISPDTKVPIADDYRYLLRIAGYNVLDATNYKDAEKLIMFVEVPEFDWQSWNSWELSEFGAKDLVFESEKHGIKTLIFDAIGK
jgi:hypothetical protein